MSRELRRWIVAWFAASVVVAAGWLLSPAAHAGPIFLPGRLDKGRFVPDRAVQKLCYTIAYSSTSVAVEGTGAWTSVELSLRGPEKPVAAACLIPLPQGAAAKTVRVTAGESRENQAAVAGVVYYGREAAGTLYRAIAEGTSSVAILSYLGREAIVIPQWQLKGKQEMTIQWWQPVRDSGGVLSLASPLPATRWAAGPVERLSLSVTIRNPKPLRAVFSPTHAAQIERKGLHEAVARVKADRWSGSDDFRLLWVADDDPLGLRVLACRPDADEDGYFLLFGNPSGSDREPPADKDVVFVLDASGSMRGEKIEQACAAVEYCLGKLNAGDRFNVIAFGTQVSSLRDGPAARTDANLATARAFLEEIVATGRTNIAGALHQAVSGEPQPGRPRIAIFLTDGTPTAGELEPEKILAQLKDGNKSGTRIFVLGVGNDVNAHLLDQLAELSDGASEYVGEREEIDAKVATLYDRLSHPVLTGAEVRFGQLRTHSVYPQKVPLLFRGSEVMIAGRYRDGGPQEITLSGTLGGKPVEYVCRAEFPRAQTAAENDFVPPLWAARKIGYLLQEIRLHGENEELIQEVVRLSKRYGIVTEYTGFLASADPTLSHEKAVAMARQQMQMANTQQAGKWAVNQARNDRALQSRVVATAEANTYVDRQGNVVAQESVRQVGRRAFYLRDGQWVDAEEPGTRKTRTVKLFSPEYFALLAADPEFARAQQLGWAVSVNVGQERIVVEKDGQQKDESLRRAPSPQQNIQQNLQQNLQQNQQQQAPGAIQQAPAPQQNQAVPMLQNQMPRVQVRLQAMNRAGGLQSDGLQLAQLSGRPVHEPFVEPVTAGKIRRAIDDAVLFLRSQQRPDGSIADTSLVEGGTALAALTMLAAGVHPADDAQLKTTLQWLSKIEPDNTYVRAIRANVWEYALRKVPQDERLRGLLKTDFEWLLGALGEKEGWRYQHASADWDNSCTQYGVLGIWAAARAGMEPGEKFWVTLSGHFRGCQNADGGWGYVRGSGSTPNMATAGLASLFLVFDMHHGRACYTAQKPRSFTEGEPAEVLAAIDRGMTWLGKAQGNKEDGYYLYGIERTGVASGRKYVGGEDWFARGALAVLRAQQPDGSIPLGQWGGPVISTSFCTLFLVYGGAPVAVDKLQYGDGPDWNLNPRDLANLSREMWSVYERPLNWQIVSIADPPEEFEAPLLWITGSKAARFSEEQALKLRTYLLRGGTIVAEPSDHSAEFAQSMRDLLRQMFPASDYPSMELRPLEAGHGIYGAVKQTFASRPKLEGAGDGSRTFFVLSDEYLSGDWQTNRIESEAFKLAVSLLFYSTDLGTLEGKFASALPDTPPAKEQAAPVVVARVRHAGTKEYPADWDAASSCWQKLFPYVRHVTGRVLIESAPVVLGRDKLDGIQLLHVTGRQPLRLTAEEQAALKQYVEKGGTLLVDAYAGSPQMAASARAELESVFGKLQPLAADSLLAEGRFAGGEDLAGAELKLPARQLLRARGEAPRGQKLLVAMAGRRPAVVFSEFDLSAAMAGIENYRSLGYRPHSARQIVTNLLAYLSAD